MEEVEVAVEEGVGVVVEEGVPVVLEEEERTVKALVGPRWEEEDGTIPVPTLEEQEPILEEPMVVQVEEVAGPILGTVTQETMVMVQGELGGVVEEETPTRPGSTAPRAPGG